VTDRDPVRGGRLYVVATPIGNLGDVTFRAVDTLRSVPLIAAEDTRISRRLLARHAIETRMVSFHARNAERRLPDLLEHLRSGADLALVTDAGTPGVSDPGEELVRGWAAEGGTVVPIPGASAVLAAVVASGIAGPRWTFEGFLPRSGRQRRDRLARIAADERGCVIYEAPGRVAATLRDLAAACTPDRPAAIGRELTKLHEEIVRGTLGTLSDAASGGQLTLRGEFALVVGEWRAGPVAGSRGGKPGADADGAPGSPTWAEALDAARAEVERLTASGIARGEAARRVAAASGISRRQLYGAPTARDGR
jgi:16S rRNA (cytidine1402-2'-O)-methyltransferase